MGQELAKWNGPYRHQDFPMMLYMAQTRPDGIVSVGEVADAVFGGAPGAAEAWTRRCQMIVASERELAEALERGWRKTQGEAMQRHRAKDEYVADAAAHRAYEDRNMSEAAQAEAKAAEQSTEEHVAEVPVKRGPGRPRKAA
jgi:hypothetical protein